MLKVSLCSAFTVKTTAKIFVSKILDFFNYLMTVNLTFIDYFIYFFPLNIEMVNYVVQIKSFQFNF